MTHEKQLAIIEQAIVNISKKTRNTTAESYALNALRIAQKLISDSDRAKAVENVAKQKCDSNIKYRHKGIDIISLLRESVGDEAVYIYCTCETIKHLYLHEYNPDETEEYNKAEFYKGIASQLGKLHPEW